MTQPVGGQYEKETIRPDATTYNYHGPRTILFLISSGTCHFAGFSFFGGGLFGFAFLVVAAGLLGSFFGASLPTYIFRGLGFRV